jgi:FkbM family methyltransferase
MNTLVKSAYDLFPFKKQAFLLLQHFYHPPQALYQRLNFDGPFRVQFPEGEFLLQNYKGHEHVVENEIFWNGLTGGWEKASLALWVELCKSSSTIFDIGSNTGIYSLIAKAVNPGSNVFAFEPVPQIFRKLQANIRLNGHNTRAYDSAVSNRDGVQKIFTGSTEHTYTASLTQGFDHHTIGVDVQTMKLSTLIRGQHIRHIDLMKIDVETHEAEVLEGMEDFLGGMMPTLLIEILAPELGERIEKLLAGKGYRYFSIDETAGPTEADNLHGGASRNFLICRAEVASRTRTLNGAFHSAPLSSKR